MKSKTFIMVLLLVCDIGQVVANDKRITLTAAEYPPYYGKNLKNYGPVTEIIVEAYRKVGYEVTTIFYPWVRAEILAMEGKYDGMIPPWFTKERAEYFVFSAPLFPNNLSFYKRKDVQITYKKAVDLKPYRIGVVRGYANPKILLNAGLQFEGVTLDVQNLHKLAARRIDLAVMDNKVADFLIQNENPRYAAIIEKMSPQLESKMQYLCLSKKAKNYQIKLKKFNNGLKLLRSSGEFEKILLSHGL